MADEKKNDDWKAPTLTEKWKGEKPFQTFIKDNDPKASLKEEDPFRMTEEQLKKKMDDI